MLTMQRLNRLWQQKRFGQLLRDVTASRPEAGMGLDLRLAGPSAAAAASLLRLGELHQLQTPLARELVRHLLFAQCADGRWTAGACQTPVAGAGEQSDQHLHQHGQTEGVSARHARELTIAAAKTKRRPSKAGKAEGIRRAIARVGPAAADAMLTALVLRSLCSLPREPAAGRLTQVTLPDASLSTSDACQRGFDWLACKQQVLHIGTDRGFGWGGDDAFDRCIATGFVLLQLGRQAEFRDAVDLAGATEVGRSTVAIDEELEGQSKTTQHERGAKQLVWDHASLRVGGSLVGVTAAADGRRVPTARATWSGRAASSAKVVEPSMPLLLRV
ncbi:MAG: hypothetical protein AAGK78_00130 [Planctomycetota bacterium]